MNGRRTSAAITVLLAMLLALGVAACGTGSGSGGVYDAGGSAAPAAPAGSSSY